LSPSRNERKDSQIRTIGMKRKYANYVEHPRFGRCPQITGLNPESDLTTGQPFLHWNAADRIANTAIPADLSRQSPARCPSRITST
jgi:hypothetical protein